IVDVRLVLHAAAQTLAPVAITAREDILRKRNHLDGDDIVNSPRPILDGLDAITKLRPDMVDPPENSPADPCGLFNLWVNGRRVPLPSDSMPVDDPMLSSRLKSLTPAPLKWVAYALSQIKPEHIEEVTYKGCNDKSMEGVAARNAAFVVLKSGIGYDWAKGSFVVGVNDNTAAGQIAKREHDRADHPPGPALPSYRHRLLGLYDQRTGDHGADHGHGDGLARLSPRRHVDASHSKTGIRAVAPGHSHLAVGHDAAHAHARRREAPLNALTRARAGGRRMPRPAGRVRTRPRAR